MSLRIDRTTNLIIDSDMPDLMRFELDEDKIYNRLSYPVDDLMAPIISLLNQKGYKTNWCCSGHFTNGIYRCKVTSLPLTSNPLDDFDASRMTMIYNSNINRNKIDLAVVDKQKYVLDTVPYVVFDNHINELVWKEKKPFKGTVWEEVIHKLDENPFGPGMIYTGRVNRKEMNSEDSYGFGIYMNMDKFDKRYEKYSDDYFKSFECLLKETKKLYDIIKDKLEDYESIQ